MIPISLIVITFVGNNDIHAAWLHRSSERVEWKLAVRNLVIQGSIPTPASVSVSEHCIRRAVVYHCCVKHVKDPRLAILLHCKCLIYRRNYRRPLRLNTFPLSKHTHIHTHHNYFIETRFRSAHYQLDVCVCTYWWFRKSSWFIGSFGGGKLVYLQFVPAASPF